jgi:hypothetical protein
LACDTSLSTPNADEWQKHYEYRADIRPYPKAYTQEMLKLPAKAGGFDPPKGRQ